MANSDQAIKRARQNKDQASRNRLHRSRMRTAIKKLIKTMESNIEQAVVDFRQVISIIDHTVSKGVIHRNQAGRLKSRLNKKLKLKVTQANS